MKLINHPVLCNYYVTYRCNAKCDFCDIWEKPSPYITLKNAEENFQALRKLGVKVVDFTGGEPLLHRQLDQLLRLAKDYGFITTVTTNCLLYPKWAEKLRGLIDMLHFSLDSMDADTHNRMRGVECHAFVMDSIQIAKNLGERPDIILTVFNENLHEIDRIYEEVCVPNNLVLILNPAFEYNEVNAETLNAHTLRTLEKWKHKPLVYLNDAFLKLRRDGGNKRSKPVCRAGSSTIVISPENKLVLPCYHLGIEEIAIGNNLYALYRSSAVQQLIRREGTFEACEGCTINCYMQPSFATHLSKYWFYAAPSTFKYNLIKGTWKKALA